MITTVEAVKSRLARGYSRSAPRYDALAGSLYQAGIRQLLPRVQLPPGAAILDVGCGTGVNLLEAALWFAPTRLLCGIDIAPGMVELASAKAHQLGVRAHFTVGDAERLPYPDGLFDLVICNSVLHWFRDRAGALREMRRVLRPGGQLALICAASPGFTEWFSLLDAVLRLALGPAAPSAAPNLPNAPEVALLLQAAGFTIGYLEQPLRLETIHDPRSYVQLMATVAPQWAADISPHNQALIEQVACALMRHGFPNGFPSTWSAVEAVASRLG